MKTKNVNRYSPLEKLCHYKEEVNVQWNRLWWGKDNNKHQQSKVSSFVSGQCRKPSATPSHSGYLRDNHSCSHVKKFSAINYFPFVSRLFVLETTTQQQQGRPLTCLYSPAIKCWRKNHSQHSLRVGAAPCQTRQAFPALTNTNNFNSLLWTTSRYIMTKYSQWKRKLII